MSFRDNSLFKSPISSPIYELIFDPLPGASRNTLIQPTNSQQANLPNNFKVGQSVVLGFTRITSSPNPADNGTPSIYCITQDIDSPPGTGGANFNPYQYSSIYISSTNGSDTSIYQLVWYNNEPSDSIKELFNLI